MRGFFALLLLTNLAFLAWQLSAEDGPDLVDPYGGVRLSGDGLKLISELEEENRPPARRLLAGGKTEVLEHSAIEAARKIESIELPDDETTTRCFQSSLLSDLDEVKALQVTLNKAGVENSGRRTVEATVINYWVKLNPYRNRAKANEAADILKKNRIKDFFIVRSGRHENAISLGVFSTRERAEMRLRQITALQARLRKPVIEAMELPAKRLVVEFSLAPGSKLSLDERLFDSSKQPHLKKISCQH